ncbi:hypothetical protein KRE43_05505 [Elizabethkingia meningoseptica]|nr:hypothetical protein [Elizabethkingia meningoseptica]MDE5481392.1 hypothetical protein [Elizabethkingia meningoseptica]MDE5515143.1 hypothetical protein [Elizabethkingia meningoseptica]MDE5525880.1 hypothetical protein [Elizabethkingia meningoseptica]MDE5529409.1 hypothetical protein [Elizabethkingia meningoseptica]MDE5532965.1 hypothetical protein [Elizabethkingia meningoseptica]
MKDFVAFLDKNIYAGTDFKIKYGHLFAGAVVLAVAYFLLPKRVQRQIKF